MKNVIKLIKNSIKMILLFLIFSLLIIPVDIEGGNTGTGKNLKKGTGIQENPIAKGKDKFLGNVHSYFQLTGFTDYWNQVTPENAGKWGSVESSRDTMNWGGLDAAYDFARENNFPFRFHVLIWGNQQPLWIETLAPEEQLEEIEEWFALIAQRYYLIKYIEVVNEPLHDPPDGIGNGNYMEALGGEGETGWDWIITAFTMARAYFPDSRLMLNDYNVISNSAITDNYIQIINLLKERNLIDAVGFQAHAFSTTTTASAMESNLNKLATTGLPIQVTEMDVDGPTDEKQLAGYQKAFPIFWENPAVEGITLWGWRPGMWRTAQQAYLVTFSGEERLALQWLRDYVAITDISTENINAKKGLPDDFHVYNNYPNPFNPVTQIRYDIPEKSSVTLTVYDVTGRLVKSHFIGIKNPGSYTVTFHADDLTSGLYFYRIQAGSLTEVKRMIILK